MRSSRPSDSDPRAKRLSQRDPRLSSTTWRELDRYADAVTAFGSACDERTGLGRIDQCYGELVFRAGGVIRALVEDGARGRPSSPPPATVPPGGWATDAVTAEIEAYVAGKQVVGEAPERDVHVADLALREARALPTREETREVTREPTREDETAERVTGRRAV